MRGGATAAVAIVLPRFLTRSLDVEHFSAWSLILQIAAYASYLDFGLQLAVARFIAQAIELEQKERQAKLVSSAFLLLSVAAIVALGLIALIITSFPALFHGVSRELLPDFRIAALVLAVSACMLLPLSTYTGVLIGMRRNDIPALAIGGTRTAGAIAAIVAAHRTQSLTVLALCVGSFNLLGGWAQRMAVHKLSAESRAQFQHVSRVIGRELTRFAAGLATWSFAMLLVSGLDVTIVGHFQFAAIGAYSLATMLITFFAGLTNAALSALMAPVSALHARGDSTRIRRIVVTATRLTLFVNLLLTATIFLAGWPLLRLWVGPVYAESALPVLKILALAQALRLTFAPYAVMLISIGEQSRGIPGAVCEALVNFGASIIGMVVFGPIGVAWGTLAGALCGVLWLSLRTMPSVRQVRMSLPEFGKDAILPGCAPCLPLLALCVFQKQFSGTAHQAALAGCFCLTAFLAAPSIKQSLRRLTA